MNYMDNERARSRIAPDDFLWDAKMQSAILFDLIVS